MATNDFLPFGIAAGANVMSQAEYSVLSSRANGFSSGTAVSAQLNKAWRQSSVMSSVLAQYISDNAVSDVLDNGNTALVLSNLTLAITNAAKNAGTSWVKITGKPTTLSGYGITDAMNKFAGGIESQTVTASNNLNTISSTGMYSFNVSTTNKPSGSTYGTVIHISYDQGTGNWSQYAISTPDGRSWVRTSFNNVLGGWLENWTSANFNPSNFQNTVGVQGAFKNLVGSATGTSPTATFTADELIVESSANTFQTLRSVSINPSIAISGANGLDSGTSAASTWYSVWVIWNSTTIAGLFSLNAVSPSMPSGYTHRARVGWIRTDSTGNKFPLGFIQNGRRIQYKVASGSNLSALPSMASGAIGSITIPTYSAISVSSFVPVTASSIGIYLYNTTQNSASILAPNPSYGAVGSTTNPPLIVAGQPSGGSMTASTTSMLLESTNIYAAANGGINLFCTGWEDSL